MNSGVKIGRRLMQPKLTLCLLVFSILFIPLQVHASQPVQVDSRKIFLNETFTLSYAGGGSCYYQDFPINIWVGTEIFGTIKASGEVHFYIMTDSQYNLAEQNCMRFATSPSLLASGTITSYALDWTARQNDKYHFILLNRSTNDASITVTFWT